jgi:adenosylhomocysteinase
MKNEAYVVSATSADDEMRREDLSGHVRTPINDGATVKYTKGKRSIYLVADGEAANFLHCGSVGPYIHLIQGEIFGAALSWRGGNFPVECTRSPVTSGKLWPKAGSARLTAATLPC